MRWAASDVSPSSHLAFHIPTLAGFCLLFVLCSCLVLLLWCVFGFLFCECLGIPNSPRSLDLDDRQGLIARSAMQQKKKAYTYECLKSAGFAVDAHSCFRACITIQNRKPPSTMNSDEIENVWAGLISSEPYPTALAALKAHSKPGYNTVIVRIGSEAAVPGEQNPMAPRSVDLYR